ncbi:hypothetical protein O6H91_03G071100 [Diphasiastrum complanatum]|uniref:Uncharacterized protein n=5 Tax=Diphasiastrum complanatum TaxID=34168 RepID=A0ACC2E7L4_DIPCM|nr:hypothetical protein O6H91_03G071100 [Diphasiastrum complanatum]KAJ7562489.1 hypothetical protein O6H91_03G071100 [Diphasiastrum complanatum]KAJ7562490.1 hypothetical protein O6H91_03G071100 [Diphasiastrum complanatum]KAJ7562491.1 hypothetical protein O6H91_03G071100 [Diphasiastrum complanatum]KAJ7562492.1 hypothetical protein O6H91_03G071100 [Diphasiastrum complanatum]
MALESESYEEELEMKPLASVERVLSFSRGISEIQVPVSTEENTEVESSARSQNSPDLENVSKFGQDEERGRNKQAGFEVGSKGKSRWDRHSYAELRPGSESQELHSLDPHRLSEAEEFSFHRRADIEVVSDEEFEREFGFPSAAFGSKDRSYRRANSRKYENGFEMWQGAQSSQEPDVNTEHQKINGFDEDAEAGTMLTGWSGFSPLLKTVMRTIFFVLVWYIFSTSLTLYNKLLLGAEWGKFPAPLLMNTIHFSMQALISTFMLRFCCPSLLPTASMSWKDYFVRVVPAAIATALDIDLSNASIVSITVTFATMCKSTAPVFLLLFAFAFKLETPSFKLLGIIFIISMGVLLAVARETEFKLFGFILIMLAAVMSGFRWVVTQVLLQKEEYGLSNPFAAMSCITPVMALVTGLFSLIFEPWHKLRATSYFDTPHHFVSSCLLMLLGGSLAFFMVVAEYLLISETSAVTFTVAGVVKEVVTIIVAVFFFGDHFTVLTAVGLAIIIIGVSLFNWFKYQKLVEGKLDHEADTGIQNEQNVFKYTILQEGVDAEEAISVPVHTVHNL